MKKLKQQKGITLVALVITIIVLLILAGISIQALTNTGLFAQAENAKKESEIANIKEQIQLDIYQKQLEPPVGSITDLELETILGKYGTVNKGEDGTIIGITTDKGYEILLSDIYSGTTTEGTSGGSGNQTLVSTLKSTAYGYSINYEANGVSDWSVLYNDGTNIYIMSDDYISESVSSYSSQTDARDYLKNTSTWETYATGVTGAKAYGAPDGTMLINSYNAKYGTNYKLSDEPILNTTDQLYVIESTSKKKGYWISEIGIYIPTVPTVPTSKMNFEILTKVALIGSSDLKIIDSFSVAADVAGTYDGLYRVSSEGEIGVNSCSNTDYGLRCVVSLPSDIVGTIDDSNKTVTINK